MAPEKMIHNLLRGKLNCNPMQQIIFLSKQTPLLVRSIDFEFSRESNNQSETLRGVTSSVLNYSNRISDFLGNARMEKTVFHNLFRILFRRFKNAMSSTRKSVITVF